MSSFRRREEPPAENPIDALARELESGPKPIYLLEGAEPFLAREALALLRSKLLAGDAAGERELDGAKCLAAEILDEVRTIPFFSPRRFVVVNEVDKLLAREAEAEPFLRFLDEPPPSRATLVLIAAKLDGRFKSSKVVREKSRLVDCSPLGEPALLRFVNERAKARGRAFGRGADRALLERYGAGEAAAVPLGALDAEVEKLAAAGEGPISIEEVCALSSELASDTSFSVVEAIARGDARGALETLRTIFRDGLVMEGKRERAPQGFGPIILGLLSWDLTRLFRAKASLRAGKSPRDVVNEAKAFRDRDGFLNRANAASDGGLARRHAALRTADSKLKESGDPLAVLTVLFTTLALIEKEERQALRRAPVGR